jgi:uncharacterized membrane-anchored protein
MKPFEKAQATRDLVNDLLEIEMYKKLPMIELINIAINIQKIYFLDNIETRLINIEDAILHTKN